MSEDPEPARNISGGASGGGASAAFEPGQAETRAEAVVDRLGERYWQKTYGGQDAFECLVRTILSQNTSDEASQPAHDALLERYRPDPDGGSGGEDDADLATTPADADLAAALADADHDELAETIAAAGLYNQKSTVIRESAAWVRDEFGGVAAFDEWLKAAEPETARERLLERDGVGPKTADCVLLFAGGHDGVFPVDTHVHRVSRRIGIAPPDADHEDVRAVLERDVPPEKCGFGHTATIQFGREYCTARDPACLDDLESCPLADRCDRVGVDPDDDAVVDPAEAVGGE